ncbi:MAG TPA: TlpA disulfide reductase family protein [Baekduia sp.]|nr:TlpA disulfide reductase family protein [Baekduia sp.]
MSGPLDFGPDDDPPRGPPDEERRARLERREDPDQRAERLFGTPPRPGATRPRRTYRTPIALAAITLALVVFMLAALRDSDTQPGPAVGEPMPPFAAPIATSSLEGAVNLRTARPEGGGSLACEVRGPDKLNICELYERGPVVLTFFATAGDECVRQLDVVERVRRRHPDVAFAAVALAGDRGEVREMVRERGWGLPVGHDEEGVLASVYGVAVCPQIVFARRGGDVVDTNFGEISAAELEAQVGALERRSR